MSECCTIFVSHCYYVATFILLWLQNVSYFNTWGKLSGACNETTTLKKIASATTGLMHSDPRARKGMSVYFPKCLMVFEKLSSVEHILTTATD